MSRAEIAAAARALRWHTRRRAGRDASLNRSWAAATVAALIADCAAMVRAEPTYRLSLVTQLQNRIDAGTYTPRADEIADQLLGRLMAAALPA